MNVKTLLIAHGRSYTTSLKLPNIYNTNSHFSLR